MPNAPQLLERLEAIGSALKTSGTALALLGLGSVGQETTRLDRYSDLDFFVIVKPGQKDRYINQLNWLAVPHPLAYTFRNTIDGYKALYADGIFCEFAVFEPEELCRIPFTGGRLVWQAEDFDETLVNPSPQPLRNNPVEGTNEWHLGECLTNLYVGLGRVQRGEILTGMRLIQHHAVNHLLALTPLLETARPYPIDPFNDERRYEQRYPQTARCLSEWIQGYEHNSESAEAILTFLEQHFTVDPAISTAIRTLLTHHL